MNGIASCARGPAAATAFGRLHMATSASRPLAEIIPSFRRSPPYRLALRFEFTGETRIAELPRGCRAPCGRRQTKQHRSRPDNVPRPTVAHTAGRETTVDGQKRADNVSSLVSCEARGPFLCVCAARKARRCICVRVCRHAGRPTRSLLYLFRHYHS